MRLTLSFVRCLLLLVAVCCDAGLHAQDGGVWDVPRVGGETITEPSPEATAMRRYQDFPVSYAMGTADISIPLLELPGGSIGVSLGLRYHTGGIKRNDISTGVGLGWSLTGLGQISRQINGFPDEWRGYSNNVSFDVRSDCDDVDYYIAILEARIDSEYDRYSYSFPGYSGSFIISEGHIIQLPPSELKIERVPDASNRNATDAFVFTTPDGVVYRFDEKEHIEYSYRPNPIPAPYYNQNYEAVITWNLTKINAPENEDEIVIKYTPCGKWEHGHEKSLKTFSYRHSPYMGDQGMPKNVINTPSSSSSKTVFLDQRLPLLIEGRSGCIEFTVSRDTNKYSGGPPDCISGLTLKDSDGNITEEICLDNRCVFSDNRLQLVSITARRDNIIVGSYKFSYFSAVSEAGVDLFGFANNKFWPYDGVLNDDVEFSDYRRSDDRYISANSLKSISDISGITTTIDYEPSKIIVDSIPGSVLSGEIIIGQRVKRITTSDKATGRKRVRSFEYSGARCNIDLSRLTYHDFISSSGYMYTKIYPRNLILTVFDISSVFTSSSKKRGFPVENARIFYSCIDEFLSGTNIDKDIRTSYEYDLEGCCHPYIYDGGNKGFVDQPNYYEDKHLGNMPTYYHLGDDIPAREKTFEAHPTTGMYEEQIGLHPLLRRKTIYEWDGQSYNPRVIEEQFYSKTDSSRVLTGLFCESNAYKIKDIYTGRVDKLNIEDLNDINSIPVYVTTGRMVCDSMVTTTIYPDGNHRRQSVRYMYTGRFVLDFFQWERIVIKPGDISDVSGHYLLPGFYCDSISYQHPRGSFYPLGTVVSSGGESIAAYRALSEFAGDKLRAAGCDLKRLPVVEKWVLRTAAGADSLLRRYEYGRFGCGGNTLTRPTRVYVQRDGPEASRELISSQRYLSYDSRGRITEMVDAQGRRIRARWMDKYDLLSEMSLPDAGLTTTYTHRPLVGCTSITSPSGRKRSFSYTAGRLTEERNTAGDLVASYAYQLYGDGSASAADRVNRFSTTLHDSSGSATDVTYYDGFGMPVQTIATVAGDNLVRSAVTYDALDRPVRQYLPVPADDDSYMTDVSSAAVRHYGDSQPFARMTYRNMAGDKPLEVIREGEKMQDHPERYEYLCNNTTDAMLRCRRYRLAASADSESITLDGDYPAGALDVTRATDPDGCTLLTFTDWRGLRILERRVVSDSQFADTYYLYDILGNVRVILQPEGAAKMTSTTKTWTTTDDVIDQYAFINRYDRRGNCVYAKVPGAGPVEMRYDPLNRLAFRQTATMAEQGESEFTLYDPIGRPALTGIATVSPPNTGIPVMTATYAPGTVGRDSTGYTVPAPFYHINLRTTLVNYYDSYDFATRPGFSSLPADNMNMNASTAKGQVTGSRTAILDSDENNSRIYSIVDYDIEDRPISRIESTVLADTYLHTAVGYTRQSHILSSELTLQRSDTIHVLRENNWLDALGNLMHLFVQTFRHNVDVTEYQKLVRSEYIEYYTYNALGQVVKAQNNLKRNNTTRYTYNHRGQITSITAPNFTQKLKYEDGETPCFNGNISEMTVAYNGCTPIYRSFTYDLINRITSQTSTDHHDTSYSYNLNSCPLTISRFGPTSDGTIGTIDCLDLLYDGNRLTSVLDYTDPVLFENSMDFASFEASYNYDSDGRMIADTGRDIEIEYNEIGLPAGITIGLEGKLVYTYSANGQKIAEHYIRPYEGRTDSRYYIGPFEFISTEKKYPVISRINTRFGYFTGKGALMKTVADYQGNIRAVVDIDGNAVQTTDYYPYGIPMATSTGATANRYKYGSKELETRNGLNFHDFEARMLFNDHTLFNRPDPHAGKYPHLNPYLYCAANPLRYIDPTGEILELSGNEDDLKFVIDIYQRAVGNVGTVSLNENNQVQLEIKEGTDLSSNVAAKTLNDIINNSNTTTLNVENGSMVIIGDASTGTIDIGDIKALGTEAPANDIGALFHETFEQYLIQVKNLSQGSAHTKALNKEGRIVGAIINLGLDRTIDADNGLIDFKFMNGHDTIFIDILFNPLDNNITNKKLRK